MEVCKWIFTVQDWLKWRAFVEKSNTKEEEEEEYTSIVCQPTRRTFITIQLGQIKTTI